MPIWLTVLIALTSFIGGMLIPSPLQRKAKDGANHLREEFKDEIIDKVKK